MKESQEDLYLALLRHGLSEANGLSKEKRKSKRDKEYHLSCVRKALEVPNELIRLEPEGKVQVLLAGARAPEDFCKGPVLLVTSPFERTTESAIRYKLSLMRKGVKVFGPVTNGLLREFISGSEATNDAVSNGHITDVYGEERDWLELHGESLPRDYPYYFNHFPEIDRYMRPIDGDSLDDLVKRITPVAKSLEKFAISRDISDLKPLLIGVRDEAIEELRQYQEILRLALCIHSVEISAFYEAFGLGECEHQNRIRTKNGEVKMLRINCLGEVREDEVSREKAANHRA